MWKKIVGIIGSSLAWGFSGFQLKDTSGVAEFRNSGDTDYAIVRCDSPVGNDDAATKEYVDSAVAGATNAVKVIRYTIDTTASTML